MAFKDLGDWSELGGLKLPIGGKTYALPAISAELGPRLQALVAAGVDIAMGNKPTEGTALGKEVLDDLAERDLYRNVLGPVYDEMIADGVTWPALKHAAMTAVIDAALDRDTAEKFWESPPGKPPARKPRQPTDRKARKATATKTTRASTAGTTSRRTTARAPAKTTRGRKSSNTGN